MCQRPPAARVQVHAAGQPAPGVAEGRHLRHQLLQDQVAEAGVGLHPVAARLEAGQAARSAVRTGRRWPPDRRRRSGRCGRCRRPASPRAASPPAGAARPGPAAARACPPPPVAATPGRSASTPACARPGTPSRADVVHRTSPLHGAAVVHPPAHLDQAAGRGAPACAVRTSTARASASTSMPSSRQRSPSTSSSAPGGKLSVAVQASSGPSARADRSRAPSPRPPAPPGSPSSICLPSSCRSTTGDLSIGPDGAARTAGRCPGPRCARRRPRPDSESSRAVPSFRLKRASSWPMGGRVPAPARAPPALPCASGRQHRAGDVHRQIGRAGQRRQAQRPQQPGQLGGASPAAPSPSTWWARPNRPLAVTVAPGTRIVTPWVLAGVARGLGLPADGDGPGQALRPRAGAAAGRCGAELTDAAPGWPPASGRPFSVPAASVRPAPRGR